MQLLASPTEGYEQPGSPMDPSRAILQSWMEPTGGHIRYHKPATLPCHWQHGAS